MLPRGRTPDTLAVPRRQSTSGLIRGTTYDRSVIGAEEFVISLPPRKTTIQTHESANHERVLAGNMAGFTRPITRRARTAVVTSPGDS